ncbi:MAG: hypothetical protein OEW48_08810 [Phycisphaerae bacterium]|nr:hypothetical protein [Phycisphaerae bacterium]
MAGKPARGGVCDFVSGFARGYAATSSGFARGYAATSSGFARGYAATSSGFARGYAATSWIFLPILEIAVFFPVEMAVLRIAQINMIEK